MRTGGSRWASFLAPTLFVALACGPAYEPKKPVLRGDELIGEDEANVDVTKAKVHIENAVAALRDGKLEEARRELDKAEPYADELKREEIRRVRQSVDEEEANQSIPAIHKLAESGKCEAAVKQAAAVMEARKQTSIPSFIKKGTSKKLLGCLLNQLTIDLSVGRELAESPDVKTTLDKSDHQTFITKVTDATVQELIEKFEEPLAQREWGKAKALLDELLERKEAGANEYNRIMGLIREGIGKEIEEKVTAALDEKKGVADVLTEVDELIAVGEWGKKQGSAVGGEPFPATLAAARDRLALWAVCVGLKCNLVSPRASFTYGHVDVMPTLEPTTGKKVSQIQHGTEVWRLAESSGWILIAKKDPGTVDDIGERVKKAAGWIKASGNKLEDTREMLPPGDSIVGARVWGPLREGQKEWELGKVMEVKGNDLAVQRIADFAIITVARSAVRFGTVSAGTKVLARCDHPLNLEPAVIDKVSLPKSGDPVATLTCLEGGKRSSLTRQEQLGALRSKPEWLPPRR